MAEREVGPGKAERPDLPGTRRRQVQRVYEARGLARLRSSPLPTPNDNKRASWGARHQELASGIHAP